MSKIIITDITIWLVVPGRENWRLATVCRNSYPTQRKELSVLISQFNHYTFLTNYHKISLPRYQVSHKTDLFVLLSGMLL